MPEFPLCSHSPSFSLLESLKETGFFLELFSLSPFIFSNAKTIVNLIQESKEEAEEAARNCTTCSPCLEHFQAFSTRISLPISMIFSPFTRSLSLGFHFRHFFCCSNFQGTFANCVGLFIRNQ